MRNCWFHDWSKWEKIIVTLADGRQVDFQKRICLVCNYVEREMI